MLCHMVTKSQPTSAVTTILEHQNASPQKIRNHDVYSSSDIVSDRFRRRERDRPPCSPKQLAIRAGKNPPEPPPGLLTTESKDNGNRGINFDRLAVEHAWADSATADRVHRGLHREAAARK